MNRRQFVGGLAAAAWAAPGMPLINGGRLRTHIEELSVFGRPQGGTFTDGVSRVAYSDADVAGRAYVMEDGRITSSGPARQLLEDRDLVETAYLGRRRPSRDK